MKNNLQKLGFIFLTVCCSFFTINAQTPTVEKVEPPNWWADYSINPVRVLVSGTNLKSAKVVADKGLTASNVKISANGHYLFADVSIPKNQPVGKYDLKITTASGTVNAPFAISPKIARAGRFQGYTPDDVIYFLMPDRFADGDTSNNDPAKSKGLYDRSKGRHYHGG
ncbi:MAG TPA: cyclomaltodextrinase N-terminal domain-containing protein, partial [Pyrinomonadaceae bacterium]|nr:cyclomaltodextrinase N-terminal domain-containing protein [Pyrinomonadaceae bacterium]